MPQNEFSATLSATLMELPDSFSNIDENDLAGEWQRQPQNYMQVAILLAQARLDMMEAKARMEVVEADISRDVRTNPQKYKVVKLTEKIVADEILLSQKYKDAQAAYREAQYKVDLLDGAAKTLEHKKKALENLVFMHGQMYHAAPKARTQVDQDDMRHRTERERVMRTAKKPSQK